jgi:putative ABC transport system permease protein
MRLLLLLRARLRTLLHRADADRELDDEFRYHLDREIERQLQTGVPPREARHAALRALGGVAQLQEECRDARGARWLDIFAQDLRYGVRLMRRSPGFSAAAVLTIALGIAAATAIFSVVYGVALQPLPYRDPARLVSLWTATADLSRSFVGAANWKDWRAQNTTLEDIALIRHVANYNLTGDGEPERLLGARVTANLFPILGVVPSIGRPFTAIHQEREAEANVVLLSDRLWRRRFASDPAIVGSQIRLNGIPYTVFGVMPPSFRYPTSEFDLWAPLYLPQYALTSRYDFSHLSVARLKPGVTLAQVQADLDTISARLAATYPENRNVRAVAGTLLSDTVAPVRTALYALLGAVGCLLLIGAVNVANLFLARGLSRSRDRALRSALGASRGRLAAQAMLEVFPIVALGAAAGILAAMGGLRALVSILPATMPRLDEIRISAPVLVFSGALLVLTAAVVAFWPALQAAGTRLANSLRIGDRGSSAARGREVLVVAEVALTVMLVAGSCLLARSFAEIRGVDPGFQPSGALSVHLAIPRSKYRDDPAVAAFAARLVQNVEAVPGVVAAGMVNRLPLMGGGQNGNIEFEGVETRSARASFADWRSVTPGYFRAMGIPLVSGRLFTGFDTETSKPVGLIDADTARQIWPRESPLGKRFRIPFPGMPWVEIVGVVGNIKHDGLDSAIRTQVYWPYRQRTQDRMALVVRTAGDPAQWMAPTIAAIRATDPEQPVYNAFTMEEIVDRSVSQRRLNAVLVGVFAGVSILLAAIGIYGVMSYAVEQRRREFGIRIALGASPSAVIARVVRRGLWIGALGSALGLAAVGALARFLATLLFQVSATDWISYSAAALALIAVASAASYFPVRRAVAQDPVKSLRAD